MGSEFTKKEVNWNWIRYSELTVDSREKKLIHERESEFEMKFAKKYWIQCEFAEIIVNLKWMRSELAEKIVFQNEFGKI